VTYNKQLSLFDDFDDGLEASSKSEIPSKEEIEENKDLFDAEENKINILALSEIPGVGFVTVRKLFDICEGNLSHIWKMNDEILYKKLSEASSHPQQVFQTIKNDYKEIREIALERYIGLQNRNINLILRGTSSYPKCLYDLKLAPAWLFVEGNDQILHDLSIVAVVGTREPTKMGIDAAKKLSVLLVTSGCIILSGLAEGIDEIGHRTAVDYGAPTIAVLGHGIDVVFPATTAKLRQQIVGQGGAIISEYLPKDSYSKEKFVQRNRLQAVFAKTVAIIEGKSKSGTAHTMRFAQQLQRPLFGVHVSPITATPQQELLQELLNLEYPVFSLVDSEDRTKLRNYLRQQYPPELRKRPRDSHLFYSTLKEIRRIIRDYDAKEDDLEWLIEKITDYKHTIRKQREDGN
jgi:DNA processing protein